MTLVAVGLVLILLAQHPFITYPISLALIPKRRLPFVARSSALPCISVLCCCHNEEAAIEQKVKNLLTTADAYAGETELMFYLDDCTDDTAAILRRFGDAVTILYSEGRTGKSVGMRMLVERSKGEVLAFTDANTFVEESALSQIAANFDDPSIGGVSAQLFYTNSLDSPTTQLNSVYWRLEEYIKRLESASGSIMGADGAFFAIRRKHYRATPPDIIDDMHTSLNVVLDGARLISVPAIRAFEKTAAAREDEFRRKIRIACRAFNCYRLLMPRLHCCSGEVLYKFYSHKVLRWFSFAFASLGSLSTLAGLIAMKAYGAAAMITMVGLTLLLLGRLNIRPFSSLYEFAISLLAATLGVLESLRGRRYQTWTIAASGR